jgi:hypothetical protein
MTHHLIFEGAELSGKSWVMSQVYNYLEPKYNQSGFVLDGCHWFNCDVGIYGTSNGKPVIKNYLNIFQALRAKNLLIEKFYISDIIYNRLHNKEEVNYNSIEKSLLKLNCKIILIIFPADREKIQKRLNDRLRLYPHYEKIMHNPDWYIKQQKEYIMEVKKSSLPYLIVETDKLPDDGLAKKVLEWIGEV